jgi:hypothetical protein
MKSAHTGQIEGYAIVSEDGMVANAAGVMPDELKFDADRAFFERALDQVPVVVHGAHSNEQQPHSHLRHRLVVTSRIPAIANDPSNAKALFWNPAGASFEQALAAIGAPDARVGIVGGPEVFGMFLDRYDFFYLSRAPNVWLPGGRPVFPGVPLQSPEQVLASHGLVAGKTETLDQEDGVTLVCWQSSNTPSR